MQKPKLILMSIINISIIGLTVNATPRDFDSKFEYNGPMVFEASRGEGNNRAFTEKRIEDTAKLFRESAGAPTCSATGTTYEVTTLEELYFIVNSPDYPSNPFPIFLFPGTYTLSANDAAGNARPNGGRLELQPNMALCGTTTDRAATIIDASNLPTSSYNGPTSNSGALRMGNGDNTIEWLTVRNAVAGGAQIIVHRSEPGTSRIRLAHIDSNGGKRGIDIRNVAGFQSDFHIVAEIVDSDLHSNIDTFGESTAQGLRVVNVQGVSGNSITVHLAGNRFFNNKEGLLAQSIGSTSFGLISIYSNGDRYYGNGGGATIGGGFGPASNNTTNFTAIGAFFENNNTNAHDFFLGGLIVAGGTGFMAPSSGANNLVTAVLRNCHFANNHIADLGAFGAASRPTSAGLTATNNRAVVSLFNTHVPNLVTAHSDPVFPAGNNSVFIRRSTPFDYDGDGKTDLSVFRRPESAWYIAESGSGNMMVRSPFQSGSIPEIDSPAPSDYDGDGKTDITIVRDEGDFFEWHTLRSSDHIVTRQFWGTGWKDDLLAPADFDGDGKTDISVYRQWEGRWYILNSSNGETRIQSWGLAGDLPRPADFDGDGKAELAVFRRSDGKWYVFNNVTGTISITEWGINGDRPVSGDYNGDGRSDFAVYRPSNHTWYIQNSNDGATRTQQWGLTGDRPVPGDYDGDGKTDVAVWRPSDGTWYVLKSTSGVFTQSFGTSGDTPTPNAFVH